MTFRAFLLSVLLCFSLTGCLNPSGGDHPVEGRPSDAPIIPVYLVNLAGVLVQHSAETLDDYIISAAPRSFTTSQGSISDVAVLVHAVTPEEIVRLREAPLGSTLVEGRFLTTLQPELDGSLSPTRITVNDHPGAFLLYAVHKSKADQPPPHSVPVPERSAIFCSILNNAAKTITPFEGVFLYNRGDIYASKSEIEMAESDKTFSQVVKSTAAWKISNVGIDDSKCTNDTAALAIAILSATDAKTRKEKRHLITQAMTDLLSRPVAGTHFVVGRNLLPFLFAGNMIGFRTQAVEEWLLWLATEYRAPYGKQTLTFEEIWHKYGNNIHGLVALNTLTAIYAYLGDREKVEQLFAEFAALIEGGAKGILSLGNPYWYADTKNRVLINPPNSFITCGGKTVDVSGIFPALQGGLQKCSSAVLTTSSHWYMLELLVTYARMVERFKLNAWVLGRKAIFYAAKRLNQAHGDPSATMPQFAWVNLPIDRRYRTRYSCLSPAKAVLGPGTGWAFAGLDAQLAKVCGSDSNQYE